MPENSCRIYGTFECRNTVGTIEFIKSGRTGNVLNTQYGSVIRVKKVLVNVDNKTDVTPIIKNWPTDNRFFGEYDNPNSRKITNDSWYDYTREDRLNTLGDNGFVENGAYLLIDRCNKVILSDKREIEVKKVTVGIAKEAAKLYKGELEQESYIISKCTGLSMEEIDDMNLLDYKKLVTEAFQMGKSI